MDLSKVTIYQGDAQGVSSSVRNKNDGNWKKYLTCETVETQDLSRERARHKPAPITHTNASDLHMNCRVDLPNQRIYLWVAQGMHDHKGRKDLTVPLKKLSDTIIHNYDLPMVCARHTQV